MKQVYDQNKIVAVLIGGAWYNVAQDCAGKSEFLVGNGVDEPGFSFVLSDDVNWAGQQMMGPISAIQAVRYL